MPAEEYRAETVKCPQCAFEIGHLSTILSRERREKLKAARRCQDCACDLPTMGRTYARCLQCRRVRAIKRHHRHT
jgi:hypothetical protein